MCWTERKQTPHEPPEAPDVTRKSRDFSLQALGSHGRLQSRECHSQRGRSLEGGDWGREERRRGPARWGAGIPESFTGLGRWAHTAHTQKNRPACAGGSVNGVALGSLRGKPSLPPVKAPQHTEGPGSPGLTAGGRCPRWLWVLPLSGDFLAGRSSLWPQFPSCGTLWCSVPFLQPFLRPGPWPSLHRRWREEVDAFGGQGGLPGG